MSKKKMADIIDEAKYARGETIRGPLKLNSRIMSLAQPKRIYVQAHSEEYQTKYGRHLPCMAGLAWTPTPPPLSSHKSIHGNLPSPKNRMRRKAISNVAVKQSSSPQVQTKRVRPKDKTRQTRRPVSYKKQTMAGSRKTTSLKAPDRPENVEQMVAVETYVRSHYGRFRSTEPTQSRDQMTVHNSRVLFQRHENSITDLSADEVSKELHHIIDKMVTSSSVSNPKSTLTIDETNFKVNRSLIHGPTNSINDEDFDSKRTYSDFDIAVLDDKLLNTAVQSQGIGEIRDDTFDNDTFVIPQDQLQTSAHTSFYKDKLERTLYSQISGAFQKRLLLKNRTLTPNQEFHLEADDNKSLIVKSTVSNVSDLKADSRLGPHLNWDLSKLPVKIATVGYAFPETESFPNPELTSLPEFSTPNITGYRSAKVSHQETYMDHPAQVHVQDILIKKYTGSVISDNHEDINDVDKCTKTDISSFYKQSVSTSISVTSIEANALAQENVDYSTSLEILMGLLNEVQKITRLNSPKDIEYRNLETMLRGAVTEVNEHRDLMTTLSLDSYFVSDRLSDNPNPHYLLVDKEVGVDMIVKKELIDTFTDVPSIFPIVLNQDTSTCSLVFPKSSNQSMNSLDYYPSMCSNESYTSHSNNNIIDLPLVEPVDKKVKRVKKVDNNVKSYEKAPQHTKHSIRRNAQVALSVVRTKRNHKTTVDFDPLIKIKRDVLVTVYSILVFTVFAALSFPDMALFGAIIPSFQLCSKFY